MLPCGTCGAPGVTYSLDMTLLDSEGELWEKYAPRGEVKVGCRDHPVSSFTYTEDGELITDSASIMEA